MGEFQSDSCRGSCSPQYEDIGDSPGQLFGSSAPAPCCRSSFPEEPGSCLANEHCIQETAPYCSAFGFCTQQRQYGYSGCVACPQHSASASPYTPIQFVVPSSPYTAAYTA